MANRAQNFPFSLLPLSFSSLAAIAFLLIVFAAVLIVVAGCSSRPEHLGPPETAATYPVRSAAQLQKLAADVDKDLQQDGSASSEDADSEAEGQQDREGSDGEDQRQAGSSGGTASSASTNSGGTSGQSTSASSTSSSSGSGTSIGSGSQGAGNSGQGSGQTSGSSSNQSAGAGSGQTQSGGSSQSTAPRTITVSIEIEARTAHAAQPAAVAGISTAGVILSQRDLTLPEGATVRQALDASGVRVNARGAYIAGIGGLSEGDIGPRSGWMYSVNGQFPNSSASAFGLSAGDRIVWSYTLDGGADLGAGR